MRSDNSETQTATRQIEDAIDTLDASASDWDDMGALSRKKRLEDAIHDLQSVMEQTHTTEIKERGTETTINGKIIHVYEDTGCTGLREITSKSANLQFDDRKQFGHYQFDEQIGTSTTLYALIEVYTETGPVLCALLEEPLETLTGMDYDDAEQIMREQWDEKAVSKQLHNRLMDIRLDETGYRMPVRAFLEWGGEYALLGPLSHADMRGAFEKTRREANSSVDKYDAIEESLEYDSVFVLC